jgi:hypothetical protein
MANHYVPDKNQRMYGGNMYQAAPSAPTLEIKINQNNSPSPSPSVYGESGNGVVRHPAPSMAPPAPPTFRPPSNPYYATPKNPHSVDNRKSGLFRFSLVQAFLALLLLGFGVSCTMYSIYCRFYSVVWSPPVFLVTALVGIVASRKEDQRFYVATLVLSLVSIVLCVAGCIIAYINWTSIGDYSIYNQEYCVLGNHSPTRISYIYRYVDPKYDYVECLSKAKIGITVNGLQFVLSIIIAMLNLVSSYFCVRKIGSW